MTRLLEATGVRKSVGGERVLRGIDLAVDAGEITVIMGPNGVGKTLLLCCLSGGVTLDSGRISVRGRPLAGGRKRDLNLLLQGSMAVDHLTGRENIDFYGKLHAESTGRWAEYVDAFDLRPDLDRNVRDYSGGTKRKLEIAVTLDADVPVYLLDEPTAGLDLAAIRSVHDALLRERDRGKATLVTSHTPLDMEVADTVLFLREGRVVAEGPPEELVGSLPDVIRIRGSIGRLSNGVADRLIGNRLFERGDEARGFLRPDTALDRIERGVADAPGEFHVTIESPSYTDLFNFHTKLDAAQEGDR